MHVLRLTTRFGRCFVWDVYDYFLRRLYGLLVYFFFRFRSLLYVKLFHGRYVVYVSRLVAFYRCVFLVAFGVGREASMEDVYRDHSRSA